jgi:2-C-methyl-D-erythritol 4-phosphate cytidylyltransferase
MNIAVVFAGGIGSRMNSRALPKQFLEVHGKPILVHTLEKFENHPEIDAIALAILPEWREHTERMVRRYELTKVRWIVNGGATGQESRHKALRTVAADVTDATDVVVLIHDGVRPLITADLISENIATAREHGNAITCTKFNETVAVSADATISDVIPRDHIYAAQAPQTFHLDEILSLYDDAVERGEHDSIDSCTLMQSQGRTLYRVDGPRSNIKITTAEDFYVCRTYFDVLENQQIAGMA